MPSVLHMPALLVPRRKALIDTYPAILRVADRLSPAIRSAFLRAIVEATNQIDVAALVRAVELGQTQRVNELLHLDTLHDDMMRELTPALQSAFIAGAAIAHEALPATASIRFDLINPHAVTYAREQTGTLIQITRESSRAAIPLIRSLIEEAVSGEHTTREVQRLLRPIVQDVLGMTTQQQASVDRYYRGLLESGKTHGEAAALTEDFSAAKVKQRANMIGHTEVMAAENGGQSDLWRLTQSHGYLPDHQQRAWLVTDDDKTCEDVCLPMAEITVGLDEPWILPDGEAVDGPPGHPHCRCSMALDFKTEQEG